MEGNEKLILGLIWQLILRYQICGGGQDGVVEKGSPKALMLAWVNDRIKDYPVPTARNFKNSFSDGAVLTALVDSCKPGICSVEGMSGDPLIDIDRAMAAGTSELNPAVPRLLEPQYMKDAVDDLSTMAYVAQFKDWVAHQAEV
eukprot:748783_1